MTTYNLFYNATDKVATLKSGTTADDDEVSVSSFEHDSSHEYDVLYEHVRFALDAIGVTDMAYITIVDTVDEESA